MSPSAKESIGRLHLLLVHFPIAFLLLAGAREVWRLKRDSPTSASFTLLVAILGAIAAVTAALTGWVSGHEHYRSDTAVLLDQHRWLGIATAVPAVTPALIVWRWNESAPQGSVWLRRGIAWTAAIVPIIAAQLGTMLVLGEDHFSSA